MITESRNYICINCGTPTVELCKKYSETVLKLVNCSKCKLVADKYIEYDIVIVIIDLILLQKEAYRHILYNSEFTSHWKLAAMLQMMEAYSDWVRTAKHKRNYKLTYEYATTDVELYMLSFRVIFRSICYLLIILALTAVYNLVKKQKISKSFPIVWKAIVLSNFGSFLLLPSLIWDSTLQDLHIIFVALYTTLSQLLAYTVVCNCVKLWSVAVIVIAYNGKMYANELYDIMYSTLYNFLT